MSSEPVSPRDPRIEEAIAELQRLITAQYPQATFEVFNGEDPEGVYLTAVVDTDDLTTVLEAVSDRLVDMQVEEGLPVYVVATRPLRRVLEVLKRLRRRRRPRLDLDWLDPPA
jgi:hypothetical protein